MLSNRIARLAPPPRAVPLPTVGSAMLGLTGGIGAAFLVMGLGTVWFCLGDRGVPPWVWGLLLAFVFIGAVLFTLATVQGLRWVALLRYGVVASAEALHKHATNTYVNDQPVLRYVYRFRARDGRAYSGASRALGRDEIGDEAGEPVLYLPSNPKLSGLVDALPLRCPLDVDDDGQWVSYESVWPLVRCGLAWGGVAALVGYGVLRVLILANAPR